MVNRATGSTEDFDAEWQAALRSQQTRYLIYPTLASSKQFDTFEWIKAQQVISLLKTAGIENGDILEYGCGAAGISGFLASIGYSANICDLSIHALQLAQLNQQVHNPQRQFKSSVVANALELPYPDGKFVAVMSYGLLEHFEPRSLEMLLHETIRVLKPGGLFIADIVPSIKVLNARTLGVLISYTASMINQIVRGNFKRAYNLHKDYFDAYYESKHNASLWESILKKHNLEEVSVLVCRPFPPFAVQGKLEASYSALIQKFLPLHQKFDQAQNWFTRRWGWLYLVDGKRPSK